MKYKSILYRKSGEVVTITFNRPHKLNAFNIELWTEFSEALDRAESDLQVKVVVLTGAGERAFCVGDDINDFARLNSVAEARDFSTKSSAHSSN